ncbi:MAG TPA: chemotaxis protein CheW, partial [Myxococcota bacterium]
ARLGLQLGDRSWLLDPSDAAEVVPVPPLVRVPFTRPWFAGVAGIRGRLFGVVDLAAFFGGDPTEPGEATRLVIVAECRRINCALLCTRVLGLLPGEQFVRDTDPAPAPAWVEGRYRDAEGQRWHALSMNALLTHPDFIRIELPGEAP